MRAPEVALTRSAAAQEAVSVDAPDGGGRALKRVGGALLGIGLLASGFVAAAAISGTGSQATVAAPQVPASVPAPDGVSGGDSPRRRSASKPTTTKQARRSARAARRRAAATARKPAPKRGKQAASKPAAAGLTIAAVERRLLNVIVQSPAGKLPPTLIDVRTGLPKNNLQAVCTRGNDLRSFVCVVTSALQPDAAPVYVHYRPTRTGRGAFTWYRSRSG